MSLVKIQSDRRCERTDISRAEEDFRYREALIVQGDNLVIIVIVDKKKHTVEKDRNKTVARESSGMLGSWCSNQGV